MAAKKKIISAAAAVVTAGALMLGGTMAWQSTNQTALNEASDIVNPGGRLHDDFNGENKDVYVENFADEPIIARVRLEEYFEIVMNHGGAGETERQIIGQRTDNGDGTYDFTYDVHEFTTTDNASEQAAVDGEGYSWVNWTMGGSTVYMPTFNLNKDSLAADINGIYDGAIGNITERDADQYTEYYEYADGETKEGTEIYDGDTNTLDEVGTDFDNLAQYEADGSVITVSADEDGNAIAHTAQPTLDAQLISMAEWLQMVADAGAYDAATHGNYWVYDTDGWVYWSSLIQPHTATGLLLNGIELNQVMDDSWYYAINVVAQFVTPDDMGSADGTGFYSEEHGTVPTLDAEQLLQLIGAEIEETQQGGENETQTAYAELACSENLDPAYMLNVENDGPGGYSATYSVTAYDAEGTEMTPNEEAGEFWGVEMTYSERGESGVEVMPLENSEEFDGRSFNFQIGAVMASRFGIFTTDEETGESTPVAVTEYYYTYNQSIHEYKGTADIDGVTYYAFDSLEAGENNLCLLKPGEATATLMHTTAASIDELTAEHVASAADCAHQRPIEYQLDGVISYNAEYDADAYAADYLAEQNAYGQYIVSLSKLNRGEIVLGLMDQNGNNYTYENVEFIVYRLSEDGQKSRTEDLVVENGVLKAAGGGDFALPDGAALKSYVVEVSVSEDDYIFDGSTLTIHVFDDAIHKASWNHGGNDAQMFFFTSQADSTDYCVLRSVNGIPGSLKHCGTYLNNNTDVSGYDDCEHTAANE